MAFRSPSRTSVASRCVLPESRTTASPCSHPASLRFATPWALPVRGVHFPAWPSRPDFHRFVPTRPRRGFPHPLRSAFVVSHDPDGLLLLEPCGVFRPLTPVRFGFPAPRVNCPVRFARRLPLPNSGDGYGPKDFRLASALKSPKRPAAARPSLRSPKRTVRLRLPLAFASHPNRLPTRLREPSSGHLARPGCPVRTVATANRRDLGARPHCRGCLSRPFQPPTSVSHRRWLVSVGNRPLRARLRFRLVHLTMTGSVAAAGFSASGSPPLPEGCFGLPLAAAGSEDSS